MKAMQTNSHIEVQLSLGSFAKRAQEVGQPSNPDYRCHISFWELEMLGHCEKWRDKSITDDGTVVVPISISNKKHVKWKNSSIRGGGGLRFYPSKVLLADYFPIEPGISITIHKARVCGFGFC